MTGRARELNLLGGFWLLYDGQQMTVPKSGQRLLAFLAIHERPRRRDAVAWTLWVDSSESRALASLRTACWRLPRPGGLALISDRPDGLGLAEDVVVDLHRAVGIAELAVRGRVEEIDRAAAGVDVTGLLAADLLPDWYDEWLVLEREQFRQLRLYALEALAERHLREGRYGEAVRVGLKAVACEPARESAHRIVIAAHRADGNSAEARRHVELYEQLLISAGLSETTTLDGVLVRPA